MSEMCYVQEHLLHCQALEKEMLLKTGLSTASKSSEL